MEGRRPELARDPVWALFRVLMSSKPGSSCFCSVSAVVLVSVVDGVVPSPWAFSTSAFAAAMMVPSVCSIPGSGYGLCSL